MSPIWSTVLADRAQLYIDALHAGDVRRCQVFRRELADREGLLRPLPVDDVVAAKARSEVARRVKWCMPERLPREPGVYVIADGTAGDPEASPADAAVYVGCAKSIHDRFHRTDFGHLTTNSTRSASIISSGCYRLGVVELSAPSWDDELNTLIARQEVWWYQVLAIAGFDVVNQVGNLGRTSDAETQLLVGCRIDGTGLRMYRSQQEAARVLRVDQGTVGCILRGLQTQSRGHTYRPATAAETAAWLAGDDDAVAALLHGQADSSWDGPRLRWRSGRLSDSDVTRLAAAAKGGYDKGRASGYRGVTATPGHAGQWTAYYCYDAERRSRWRPVGRRFASPLEAAWARERFLDSHPDLAVMNQRNHALPTLQPTLE